MSSTSIASNLKFKPEISAVISDLEKKEDGSATPGNILCELKDIVLEEFQQLIDESEFNLSAFKSNWTTRITTAMNDFGLPSNNKRLTNKHWNQVLDGDVEQVNIIDKATLESNSSSNENPLSKSSTTESSKRSPTSSLSYQRKLSEEDRNSLQKIHTKIEKKWILKSGACVEDIIHEKSVKFDYEHPMHSYILNINDDKWKEGFEEADQDEIKESSGNGFKNPLPANVLNLLQKINKKKSFEDIYKTYKDINVDRYNDVDLYWVKESILNYVDFFYNNNNKIVMRTEQDLLEEVYGFIRKSRKMSSTQTETASGSKASSEAKNNDRTLGATETITRQAAGDHADLVFEINSEEVACVEIGLENSGSKGTKELQEKGLKTPRMMKAFCDKILREFPAAKAENINIVGYVISGMYISALQMSFKNGSIALISVSDRLKMPESIKEVPALLPPVLALVYNGSQVIKNTVDYIEDISSTFSLNTTSDSAFFPPCFIPQTKDNKNKKRKISKS